MYFCCCFPFDFSISTVSGLRCLVTSFINFLISIFFLRWCSIEEAKASVVQEGHLPSAFLWDKAAWQRSKYFGLPHLPLPAAFTANRKAEQSAVTHPLAQRPQRPPVAQTFSSGCPAFIALADTHNCLTHFLWPIFCFVVWGLAVDWVKRGLGGAARGGSRHRGTAPGQKPF